jgi:hypothetical protein
MRTTITILFFIFSACIAHAEPLSAMGIGATTCGEFATKYKKQPEAIETLYFTWAQGFLTGANVSRLAAKQPARDLNSKPLSEQKAYLRSYCDSHPLSEYFLAVLSLLQSLTVFPSNSDRLRG